MKVILNIFVFFILSNILFGQNDFLFDNELIKTNKVQFAQATLNTYRNEKIDSLFSNITHYEFNKLGKILKETYKDYSDELVTMYITYNYDEKCSKTNKYEWFTSEDLEEYYSLMKTQSFYDDNCELSYVEYYDLGIFVEKEEYFQKFENDKLIFEEIIINNVDKKTLQNNYINDLTVETSIYFNGQLVEKYINFYNKNNDVIKFCDYSTSEVYCGKSDFVYNIKNQIIKESYFDQYEKLDHVLEFDYLENGLVNKKTTYLTDENGELFLSSIINYTYQYY